MRTIIGSLYLVASVFLFLGSFHVVMLNFDSTLFGLALTVLGIGGQLVAQIWFKQPDKTMNRIANSLEQIANK